MQSRIVKYGMDSHLCQYLCTDMTLKEIRDALYNSYGIRVSNGDIESYFGYRKEDPLYQKYLKKKG